MHTTQLGSDMRRNPDGEWCDADEVLALEQDTAKIKAALLQIKAMIEDPSLDAECLLQRISDICDKTN
jgi:hypothetical protein